MLGRGCAGYDRVSLAILVALVVLAVLLFRDYGISNDEEVQHRYGELIIDYYASGFRDTALFSYKNLYLYGGLFDIVAVGLAKLLPFDPFLIRHFLSAMIGVAGMAAVWATARFVAGPRAGLIALVAIAVCGPYFGGMFNHTKDVPFAAAVIGAIYFLLRAGRDLPTPRWSDTIGFGLMLGAATGLRAMGLLLIGYAGVIVLMSLPRPFHFRDAIAFCARSALRFAPAVLIGYLIMIAAWPWAWLAPLNPLRAIFSFAHFHYEIRTVVAGAIYRMGDVPWWYVPFYLLIKVPLVVYAGVLCATVAAIWALARDGVSRPAKTPCRDRVHRLRRDLSGAVRGDGGRTGLHRDAALSVCGAAARGACRHRLRLGADGAFAAPLDRGRRDGSARACAGMECERPGSAASL